MSCFVMKFKKTQPHVFVCMPESVQPQVHIGNHLKWYKIKKKKIDCKKKVMKKHHLL